RIDARKRTRPKLTPITGTVAPSRRANVRSIVPSPPSTIAMSAARGSSTSAIPACCATARTRSSAVCTSLRPWETTAAVLTGGDNCVDSLVEVIWEARVVGLQEMKEELPVALRARKTGVYDAHDAR